MQIGAHSLLASWWQIGEFWNQFSLVVKQFLRLVALHPGFKDLHVTWLGHIRHWHLVRPPIAFRLLTIDLLRAGPAFRAAEHDHRPARARGKTSRRCLCLDGYDLLDGGIHGLSHLLVHLCGIVTLDKIR